VLNRREYDSFIRTCTRDSHTTGRNGTSFRHCLADALDFKVKELQSEQSQTQQIVQQMLRKMQMGVYSETKREIHTVDQSDGSGRHKLARSRRGVQQRSRWLFLTDKFTGQAGTATEISGDDLQTEQGRPADLSKDVCDR
jgi:hypothetical protein